jgi:chaperonin cofactor prefoldin
MYKICIAFFLLWIAGCSDAETDAKVEKTQKSINALTGRIEWTKQRLDSTQKLNEKARKELKSLDMDPNP